MHLPVQKFPHTGGVLVLTLPLLVSPAPLHTILTVEVPSECLSCPPPPPTPTLNTTNLLIFFSVVFSRQETGVWSLGWASGLPFGLGVRGYLLALKMKIMN